MWADTLSGESGVNSISSPQSLELASRVGSPVESMEPEGRRRGTRKGSEEEEEGRAKEKSMR